MTQPKTRAVLLSTAILLAMSGCTTQQRVAASDQPSMSAQRCQFNDEQLTRIRMNALEYLLAEWPVLDALCEEIGTEVRLSPEGSCAVSGRPVIKDTCPVPSHRGYVITFDKTTLVPSNVYWLPADQ